jgi:UDP-N-acetyl-D-mannosaminuronic acid transferase (WecB/TagA/CpsF family)
MCHNPFFLFRESHTYKSTNEVVEAAQYALQQRYPNISFAHHHGYIDLEDETVVKRIELFKPQLH